MLGHPAITTTPTALVPDERAKRGIADSMIRLSSASKTPTT
ncbi:hypothetical protein [Streptomyces sp. E2N166]|nr:hypothetical protein [Streptomyces sp. E2N166]